MQCYTSYDASINLDSYTILTGKEVYVRLQTYYALMNKLTNYSSSKFDMITIVSCLSHHTKANTKTKIHHRKKIKRKNIRHSMTFMFAYQFICISVVLLEMFDQLNGLYIPMCKVSMQEI